MEKTRLLSLMIVAVLLIPVSVVAMDEDSKRESDGSLLIHPQPPKAKRGSRDGSGSDDSTQRETVNVDDFFNTPKASSTGKRRNGIEIPDPIARNQDSGFLYLFQELGKVQHQLSAMQEQLRPIEGFVRKKNTDTGNGVSRSPQRSQTLNLRGSMKSENPTMGMSLSSSALSSDNQVFQEIAAIKDGLETLEGQHGEIRAVLDDHVEKTDNTLQDIQESLKTILTILVGRGGTTSRNMLTTILRTIEDRRTSEIEDRQDGAIEDEGDEEEEIVYSGHEEYLVEDGRERRRENVESAATATVLRRQRERGRGNGQLKTTMRYKPGHTITRRQSRTFLEQSSQATQTTIPDTDVMEASPVLTASSNDTFSSTGSSMNSNMSLSSSSSSSPSSSSPVRRVLSSATPPPPSRLVSLTSGSGVSSSTSSSSSSTSASQSPERTQSVPVSSPQLLDRTQSAPVQSPPEANGVRARLYNTFSGLGSGIAGFARDLTSTDGFFPEENNKQQ